MIKDKTGAHPDLHKIACIFRLIPQTLILSVYIDYMCIFWLNVSTPALAKSNHILLCQKLYGSECVLSISVCCILFDFLFERTPLCYSANMELYFVLNNKFKSVNFRTGKPHSPSPCKFLIPICAIIYTLYRYGGLFSFARA